VTARQHVEHVLLGLGVGIEVVCVLGLLVMRDAFDRLHYAMAATSVGVPLLVAAVVVHASVGASGLNALVIGALLFLLNPVLANATARAARARRFGRIDARPEEKERGR
jgi:monovalent cation/proton antiporter MnhG/PhaG subunit